MIPLPPGCKLVHSIFFELSNLSIEVIDWFRQIGGEVVTKPFYDHKGVHKEEYFVKYGKGKLCHRRRDGTNGVRIHFHGDDATVGSMFLIKFIDQVDQHSLKEHMELMHE